MADVAPTRIEDLVARDQAERRLPIPSRKVPLVSNFNVFIWDKKH